MEKSKQIKTVSKMDVASLRRNLKDIGVRTRHKRPAGRAVLHAKYSINIGPEPKARFSTKQRRHGPIGDLEAGTPHQHEPGHKRRPTLNEAGARLLVPRLLFSSQVICRSPGTGRSFGSARNPGPSTDRFGGSIGAETMSIDQADQSYATTLRTELYTSEEEAEAIYYAPISNYRKKELTPTAERRDEARASGPTSALLKMK